MLEEKLNIQPGSVKPVLAERKRKLLTWGKLAALTLFSIYFAVFMEWLFYVTKPSFMDFMPFLTKLSIFLISSLFLFGISLVFLLLLFGASWLPVISGKWKILLWISGIVPALFLAATALLMVDNFTYTIFHFGVINSTGIIRGIYGLGFSLVLILCYRWVLRSLSRQSRKKRFNQPLKLQFLVSAFLILLSIPLSAHLYTGSQDTDIIPTTGKAIRRPNILLIGTDALLADRLSLYGYSRDTTPFLEQFSQEALMSTNNFPNSSISAGSFASIFTGKLPTTTRLLFPPDMLKGKDAVEHFPGILEKQGYYTVQISVDHYADAIQMNLQDGFYVVNDRTVTSKGLYEEIKETVPQEAAYFLSTVGQQVSARVQHIYFIQTMPNPYAEVTNVLTKITDQQRIDKILDLFQETKQPLFIHAYLMGTHMGMLSPTENIYSKGQANTNENEPNYYDDAVISFDRYMQQVVETLKKTGKLDETMIIVYSDHGKFGTSNTRLPLLIRFPNAEYAGEITNNTQNLDIAPTILDYMGIEKPDWMAGQSLLKGEPPALRPIFSVIPNYIITKENLKLELDPSRIKPPFYQFGTIGMVVCHRWYSLETASYTWKSQDIPGYPTPCDDNAMPGDHAVQQMMIQQLKDDGFDVSSLTDALAKQ